jgi:hypothetical protein
MTIIEILSQDHTCYHFVKHSLRNVALWTAVIDWSTVYVSDLDLTVRGGFSHAT